MVLPVAVYEWKKMPKFQIIKYHLKRKKKFICFWPMAQYFTKINLEVLYQQRQTGPNAQPPVAGKPATFLSVAKLDRFSSTI